MAYEDVIEADDTFGKADPGGSAFEPALTKSGEYMTQGNGGPLPDNIAPPEEWTEHGKAIAPFIGNGRDVVIREEPSDFDKGVARVKKGAGDLAGRVADFVKKNPGVLVSPGIALGQAAVDHYSTRDNPGGSNSGGQSPRSMQSFERDQRPSSSNIPTVDVNDLPDAAGGHPTVNVMDLPDAPGTGGPRGPGGPALPPKPGDRAGIEQSIYDSADAYRSAAIGARGAIEGFQAKGMAAADDMRLYASKAAEQEAVRARRLESMLNQRMAQESEMRQRLMERADIKEQPIGAKLAAGLGLLIAGFGGLEAVKMVSQSISEKARLDAENQARSFQQNLAISKQDADAWRERFAVAGDIEGAKLSAIRQNLEGARNYFASQVDLAKNEDQKFRIQSAALAMDKEVAEIDQKQREMSHARNQRMYDQAVAEQKAAASAAANRAYAERKLLEERAWKEKMQDRENAHEMGKAALSARLRGGDSAAAASGMRPEQYQRAVERYGKLQGEYDSVGYSVQKLEKLLGDVNGWDVPGQGFFGSRVPDALTSDRGLELRQTVDDAVSQLVLMRSGKAASDKERESLKKIVVGDGSKQSMMNGLQHLKGELRSLMEQKERSFPAPLRRSYHEDMGSQEPRPTTDPRGYVPQKGER